MFEKIYQDGQLRELIHKIEQNYFIENPQDPIELQQFNFSVKDIKFNNEDDIEKNEKIINIREIDETGKSKSTKEKHKKVSRKPHKTTVESL